MNAWPFASMATLLLLNVYCDNDTQITCFDSKGVKHKQLVKSGNDDLRQDAVMQQFFSLVNYLLQADAKTRKRHLKIRTYKACLETHANMHFCAFKTS